MIRISPDTDYRYACPACASRSEERAQLTVTGVAINGMRNLAYGECAGCGRRFYCDMPAGQALYTPVAIDADSGEVFDRTGTRWFSDPLAASWRNRRREPVSISVERFRPAPRLVLLNCLDDLYGDALHKLLNAPQCIDDGLECCVLIPRQLNHLVPAGVAEKWVVDLPIPALKHWYVAIEEWVRQRLREHDCCYLHPAFPHPHYTRRDLARFLPAPPDIPAAPLAPPVVTFCYREDRLWGSSLRKQQRNIEELARLLVQVFPGMTFLVSGLGRTGRFSNRIVDQRTARFDLDDENRMLGLLRQTDVAVGVYGSNMLLPSALAKSTVDLLPHHWCGNLLQDLLVRAESADVLDNLLRYRVVYGDSKLDDVTPRRVAVVIASRLLYDEETAAIFNLDNQLICEPVDFAKLSGRFQKLLSERRPYEERLARLREPGKRFLVARLLSFLRRSFPSVPPTRRQ